ncbi:MAG: hypothetical protein AB7S38_32105 [Vulcanimicrobiota bacterium]
MRQLAQEGRHRQGGQTFEHARQVGQNYLAAIAREAAGSADGIVAEVANTASAQRLYPESAYQTQNIALGALADGVGGNIGPTLAWVGYNAMHKTIWHQASEAYSDGRHVGASFLDGITSHSLHYEERLLANTARQASAVKLFHETAFRAEAIALDTITKGVVGQNTDRLLAQFGRAARMKSRNNEDARNLIYPVLNTLAQSSDSRVAALGDVGAKASGAYLYQDAGSLAQDVALAKVLESPVGSTPEADLADYGRRALDQCSRAQDQRHIGHEVLRGIARHANDPARRWLARVADNATCPRLYDRSAAGAHYEAFDLLSKNETEADKLGSRFGLAVLGRSDAADDKRTIVAKVLEALTQEERDPVKKNVLETAHRLSLQAATSVGLGLQKFAFDFVLNAPETPAGQLGGADEVDPEVLQKRLAFNTSVQDTLRAQTDKNQQEVLSKQLRMGQLADGFNPLVPQDHRLAKHIKIAGITQLVGMGAAAAGLFARTLSPELGLGLMAVGGISAAGSWLYKNNAQAKRKQVLDQYWPLRKQYDQLDGEQQAGQSAVAALKTMADQLTPAIERDQRSLEVIKLAQTGDTATFDIDIDPDAVTIGDFTIFTDDGAQDDPAPARSGRAKSERSPLPDQAAGTPSN